MDEYLIKYRDLFGENFPYFAVRRAGSETEIIEIIKHCIETKTPYNADYEEDTDY